jgi:hypothetical protein
MSKSKNTITGTVSNTITTTGTPIYNTTSGTTNTTIVSNPYVYSGYTIEPTPIEPTPFMITFAWDGKDVTVSLKNGKDIFKLARIFTEILDANNVEYNIKTNKKRK